MNEAGRAEKSVSSSEFCLVAVSKLMAITDEGWY